MSFDGIVAEAQLQRIADALERIAEHLDDKEPSATTALTMQWTEVTKEAINSLPPNRVHKIVRVGSRNSRATMSYYVPSDDMPR